MKATTHTEVYRPFRGTLGNASLRPLVLAMSGVRVGFRRKLPALLLFLVPAISTIVFSFLVHLRFNAAEGNLPGMTEASGRAIGGLLAQQISQVEVLVVDLLTSMRIFSLAAIAWYGSGLIAEDRRVKAHLLYFARPLTRWSYLTGKLGTVGFWGWMAVGVPAMVVCGTAIFASPNWSFLTERWPTILRVLGFALLWVSVIALLVLAVSSVVERRNHALAGVFGVVVLSLGMGRALPILFDDPSWALVSIWKNFDRIAEWLFSVDRNTGGWGIEATVWVIGGLMATCMLVLARNVGRMEVHA